tara:strand:- start:300 stop:665 length:366 start_codon:yes stop_codon:yes gene_type:complete
MLVVLAFCFGTAGAQELIRMDTYAFDSTRRPAAVFDHDIHNEAAELDDCAVCHHVWENGTLVEDESSEDSPCSECHGVNPTQENEMALANAFHTKCRSCHIDKGAGPILCGQCHRKMQGGE